MKHVLAELHELINDLEDQGLSSEASTLQEVFVKVAEDMTDEDSMGKPATDHDLANDVEGLLRSHSAAEVLAEIAKQMEDSTDGTSEMAYRLNDPATKKIRRDNPFPSQATDQTIADDKIDMTDYRSGKGFDRYNDWYDDRHGY